MLLQKNLIGLGLVVSLAGCGDRAAYTEIKTESDSMGETPGGGNTAGDNNGSPNSGDALPLPQGEDPSIPRGDGSRGQKEKDVNDKCAQSDKIKSYEQDFVFSDPGHTCYWDYYDNLSRRAEFIRARTEQFQLLKLDERAIVCKMEVTFDSQNVTFKDEILLAYSGVVLASSKDFSTRLPKKYGMSMYSWPAIASSAYNKAEDSRFCAGKDTGEGTCQLPTSEVSGSLAMNFSDSLFQRIEAYTTPDCRGFTVVTTGDNDENDCRHSGISFKVKVKYVMP